MLSLKCKVKGLLVVKGYIIVNIASCPNITQISVELSGVRWGAEFQEIESKSESTSICISVISR